MTAKNRQLTTAYHETGYVAAQLYFQHPFKFVSIISTDNSSGRVMGLKNDEVLKIIKNTEIDAPTAEEERF